MYGDSDKYYELLINEKKLLALDINKDVLYQAISRLSYIFPLGKIEGEKHYFFINV